MTSRKDMQIFVENIVDDILFLTFYCFSWWISIFEVNISHPIILFSFCDINVFFFFLFAKHITTNITITYNIALLHR